MLTATKLYFHFHTENGLAASLPLTRVMHHFTAAQVVGIPGSIYPAGNKGDSVVPGYKCPNCRRTFFAATEDGLKHGCMGLNGGIISDKSGTGGIE